MKKIIALLLILFLVGCTTEVIEVEPEDLDDLTPVETPDSTDTVIDTTTDTTTDTTDTTDDTTPDTDDTTGTSNTTTDTTTPTTNTVQIKEFTFDPKELTISVGDSITWINAKPDEGKTKDRGEIYVVRGQCGDMPKLTLREKIAVGEQVTYTFDEAGECIYKDVYHGDYVGTITIE